MKRESKWIISEPKTFLEFMLKHRSIRITMEENVAENAKVFRFDGYDYNIKILYTKTIPNSEFYDPGYARDIEPLLCCEAEYKLGEIIKKMEE